jgi:hypothetical protein
VLHERCLLPDKQILKTFISVRTKATGFWAAVAIEPVSVDSLRKTGIFADLAEDFRRFLPQLRQIRSLETKANARKAAISGLFSRLFGSPVDRRTDWLTIQGSNSHIPD